MEKARDAARVALDGFVSAMWHAFSYYLLSASCECDDAYGA